MADDTPQVPDTLDFSKPLQQPGSAVPKPDVKSQNAPNVNGGQASFSQNTQALSDFVSSQLAKFSAGQDALIANTKVDATAAQQTSVLTNDSFDALNRLQRINQLPPDLTEILGIFDSSWSPGYQKGRVEINQAKAAQINATAAALKAQNNLKPQLMENLTQMSKSILDAQNDANKLFLEGKKVEQADMQYKLDRIRVNIALSQEDRAKSDDMVKNLTTDQIEAILPQANAGKGPFARYAGKLQSRLVQEKSAITALDMANEGLKEKKMDVFNKGMIDFASHTPHEFMGPAIDKAVAAGDAIVNIPTGQKDKDGKPQMIPMPIDLARQGLVKNLQAEQAANASIAAEMTSKTNLIPRVTNMINSANAFTSMDPRAAQIAQQTANILQHAKKGDPTYVVRADELIKEQEKNLQNIIKESADKFASPQARAAVIAAGNNGGKFDAVGGAEVVANSTAVPAFNVASRYAPAWGKMNTMVVNEIAKDSNSGMLPADNESDAQSALAMFLAKNSQNRERINQVTKKLLADPNKMADIRNRMKGTIKDSAMGGVFNQLAQQKNANPIWGYLSKSLHENDLAEFQDNKGFFSEAKLFEKLEQATLLAKAHGNKAADFAQTYLSALRQYGATANDNGMADSSYTISDHALDGAIFGGNPTTGILNGMHYDQRQVAARVHSEFQKRIQEDLNGTTVRNYAQDNQTLQQLGGIGNDAIDVTNPAVMSKVYKQTGVNLNAVPSATGTGLTAAQIAQIYGTGH